MGATFPSEGSNTLALVTLKRWIPRIIVLAVLAGAGVYLFISKPWAKGKGELTYQTVTVGKGSIAAQVTANGTLSARGTVQVGAQVSGRVVELNVDFNDQVKKGQVIAKLDESVLRAQIDQAQASYDLAVANVHKAQVGLDDAKRQLARQQTLKEQQLVAGVAVESAEVARDTAAAAVTAARAQVSQASANLKQARTNLGYATIVSPVDGVVLSRAVDKGQTVAASLQAPTLFTIAEDLANMQIDTQVSEGDVGRLSDGMKATFTVDAFPGKTFEGIVRQVRNAPTTAQGVVTYDAVIDVDNKDKSLRPGMTASVTFVLAQVADAIKIPNAALRFKLSRDQMIALREELGMGSGSGRGGRRGSEGGGSGGRERGSGGGDSGAPSGGGPGGDGNRFGDRKPVWKLEDGKPKMVLVKPGLTDGSATEMLDGDLKPGDQLITEISGLPASQRRVGAF
jgi:HlyD family secretion protein